VIGFGLVFGLTGLIRSQVLIARPPPNVRRRFGGLQSNPEALRLRLRPEPGAAHLGSNIEDALRGSEGLATALKGLEGRKGDLVAISAASRNAAARSDSIRQAFPGCEVGSDLIEQAFPECEVGSDLIEQTTFPRLRA